MFGVHNYNERRVVFRTVVQKKICFSEKGCPRGSRLFLRRLGGDLLDFQSAAGGIGLCLSGSGRIFRLRGRFHWRKRKPSA
jgi:hypothetical protein